MRGYATSDAAPVPRRRCARLFRRGGSSTGPGVRLAQPGTGILPCGRRWSIRATHVVPSLPAEAPGCAFGSRAVDRVLPDDQCARTTLRLRVWRHETAERVGYAVRALGYDRFRPAALLPPEQVDTLAAEMRSGAADALASSRSLRRTTASATAHRTFFREETSADSQRHRRLGAAGDPLCCRRAVRSAPEWHLRPPEDRSRFNRSSRCRPDECPHGLGGLS